MMQLHSVFKKIIKTSLNHAVAEVFPSLCVYEIEDWLLARVEARFLRVLKLNRIWLLRSLQLKQLLFLL